MFFFNDTSTTEIYTLSLHDALPILGMTPLEGLVMGTRSGDIDPAVLEFIGEKDGISFKETLNILNKKSGVFGRSEEHTSELQSRPYLVCRLLLEKKKLNRNRLISS